MICSILLEFLHFAVILACAITIVVASSLIYACRSVSGTFCVLRFLIDRRYWAYSVINYRFNRAIDNGEDVRPFIAQLNGELASAIGVNGRWRFIPDLKVVVPKMLNDHLFFIDNFGTSTYSFKKHADVVQAWRDKVTARERSELLIRTYLKDDSRADDVCRLIVDVLEKDLVQCKLGVLYYACARSGLFIFDLDSPQTIYKKMLMEVFPDISTGLRNINKYLNKAYKSMGPHEDMTDSEFRNGIVWLEDRMKGIYSDRS